MDSRLLEASVSLFGIIGELDQTKTLFTLISLIGILIVFDTFLEMLEYFADDAGYTGLLRKLYKEMMTMGCISFMVFIIFNSPLELSHGDTFIIFEFAHIVLFFLAFFFVLRACSAVHYTRKAKSYFQRAHNTTALKLCKSFVEAEMHPCSLKAIVLRYGGLMSSIERTFEYRVLEDFFFKQFPLIPEEFRFVDYLSKSFKFYTIEMVEIEPRSWFFLVFLVLVNYVRLLFFGSVYSYDLCYEYHHPEGGEGEEEEGGYAYQDPSADGHHRRGLAESGGEEEEEEVLIHTCPDYVMWYAIMSGWLLLVFTIVVCIISHVQKQRLMRLAGASTAEERLQKLKDIQNIENAAKEELEDHKQFEQLSVELSSRIKSKQSVWQKIGKKGPGTGSFSVPTEVEDTDLAQEQEEVEVKRTVSRRKLHKQDSIMLEKPETDRLRLKVNSGCDADDKFYVSTLVVALGAVQRQHMRHHQEFAHTVLFWLKSLGSCFVFNCFTFRKASHRPQVNEKLLESARHLRRNSVNLKDFNIDDATEKAAAGAGAGGDGDGDSDADSDSFEDQELLGHPLLKQIDSIFLYENRNAYKYLIQLILMLDAFYLSLYATNLISVSLDSDHPILFNVLMVLTVLLMSALASYLLVLSSILFCVTSLHNKGTEWMCEQEETKRKVLPILRREMLAFLNTSDDVESFFSLISGEGDINMTDFSNFLFTLGIHPSHKEIRALFRAVDADSSGAIDLEELKALLFEPTKAFGRHLDKAKSKSKLKVSRSFTDLTDLERGGGGGGGSGSKQTSSLPRSPTVMRALSLTTADREDFNDHSGHDDVLGTGVSMSAHQV